MRPGSGPATGLPSTFTSPRVSLRKPPRMLSIVDLPQPDGPTIQTNSPGRMSKLMFSRTWTCCPAALPGNDIQVSRTRISGSTLSIAPAYFVKFFQPPHQQIENQTDAPDQRHARDDEVVTLSGIARVNDEIAEAGVDGDHLRRHDHEPCHAQCDA